MAEEQAVRGEPEVHKHQDHYDISWRCCEAGGAVNLTKQRADFLVESHEHYFRPPAEVEAQKRWEREQSAKARLAAFVREWEAIPDGGPRSFGLYPSQGHGPQLTIGDLKTLLGAL